MSLQGMDSLGSINGQRQLLGKLNSYFVTMVPATHTPVVYVYLEESGVPV